MDTRHWLWAKHRPHRHFDGASIRGYAVTHQPRRLRRGLGQGRAEQRLLGGPQQLGRHVGQRRLHEARDELQQGAARHVEQSRGERLLLRRRRPLRLQVILRVARSSLCGRLMPPAR